MLNKHISHSRNIKLFKVRFLDERILKHCPKGYNNLLTKFLHRIKVYKEHLILM